MFWTLSGSAVASGLIYYAVRRYRLSVQRESLTRRLIAEGYRQNHDSEVIPNALAKDLANSGKEGEGLLSLFVGAANWGAQGINAGDPAGLGWSGREPGHGKSVIDGTSEHPYGGLGIPHADSGFLQDAYERWGAPPGIPASALERSFDSLIRSYRNEFFAWSDALLARREVHDWIVRRWLDKYWNPAVQTNDTLRLQALNARIRNSASGVGRRLAGQSERAQIDGYVSYKYNVGLERGRRKYSDTEDYPGLSDSEIERRAQDYAEGKADRARRQIKQAARVPVIVEELRA